MSKLLFCVHVCGNLILDMNTYCSIECMKYSETHATQFQIRIGEAIIGISSEINIGTID